MNIEEIMEALFENKVKGLPHSALAEVFNRLMWCLSDNGAGVCAVKEKWLEGDSFEKCAIALHMTETFPYETASQMKDCFSSIVSKWPELGEACDQIINQRARQNV